MFGRPNDVEGECNARMYLGDDYGDNCTTIRCNLKEGHEGPHVESFERDHGEVKITWNGDESVVCKRCGKRDLKENSYNLCSSCEMKYREQGFNAFGVVYSSPYPKNSYKDLIWLEGWKEGQERYKCYG